jgi:glyoxylase-like metal-dependent hydrolase (beta-lactamase superfamily II)
MAVQLWRLGDAEVLRIEEMVGPMFDPTTFFPDFDAAVFAAERSWLAPAHLAESGRIISSMHSWLVRVGGLNVLVDGCIGDGKDRQPFHRWTDLATDWPRRLAATGVAPEDVDVVLCTHLHVDHVGWNTRLEDGRWVPTFPNARYLFARAEVEAFRARRAQSRDADFDAVSDKVWDDSVLPVLEAGLADLVDGEHEVLADRLVAEPTPGHTPGSTSLALRDAPGRERALFTGDVFHHPIQVLRPDWNSAFCELPEQARATRRALLARLADRETLLMPAHFADPFAMRVVSSDAGLALRDAPCDERIPVR